MEQSEFVTRRHKLAEHIGEGEILLVFAGNSQRKTADEMYPFFTNRSFLYLAGVRQERTALLMARREGEVKETLYALTPDTEREVWTGRRFTFEELAVLSGVADIRGESWSVEWTTGKMELFLRLQTPLAFGRRTFCWRELQNCAFDFKILIRGKML